MKEKNNLLLPSVIFSIAVLIGAIILASVWRKNYSSNQTISVTGSAEKLIVSDFAILKGMLYAELSNERSAYRSLEKQRPVLIEYLKSKGITDEQINLLTVRSYANYEYSPQGYQTGRIRSYVYNQRIEVKSDSVELIRKLSQELSSLVEKGVDFRVEDPEYYYSKLAEVKIEIQSAAAKDAWMRAQSIAKATGREIGHMTSARMGVLQIRPRYSTIVTSYGVHDLSTIEKEVVSVVSASFVIE